MNEQQKYSLIEVALQAARQEQNWMGPGHLIDKVAVIIARDGKFKEALELCREYWDRQPLLLGTLFEIACEAMRQGKQEFALKTIEVACDLARDISDLFVERIFLKHLEYLHTAGHEVLVRSILALALDRIEQIGIRQERDRDDYQLECYMEVLPYLAEQWPEKVEETIDYLLERRLGEYTEGYIKLLIPSALCNMALIIRKYGLRWNEERQDQFQNLLQEVEK